MDKEGYDVGPLYIYMYIYIIVFTHRVEKLHDCILLCTMCVYVRLKESGASKMVTNRFMPNLTMLKYIKRRLS